MYVQGAVSIVLGVLLGVGVAPFHGGTPPEDLQAVLPQVAANDYWVVVHLAQFVGDVLVLVGFVALYRSITQGGARCSPRRSGGGGALLRSPRSQPDRARRGPTEEFLDSL